MEAIESFARSDAQTRIVLHLLLRVIRQLHQQDQIDVPSLIETLPEVSDLAVGTFPDQGQTAAAMQASADMLTSHVRRSLLHLLDA